MNLIQRLLLVLLCVILFNCSSSDDTPVLVTPEQAECPEGELVLEGSIIIDGAEALEAFKSLGYTRVNGTLEVNNLSDLSFLQCLTFVEELVVGGASVFDLSDLVDLSFNRLSILNCDNLISLEGVGNKETLERLKVIGNDNLINLKGMSSLRNLGILDESGNPSLIDLTGLENLVSNPFVEEIEDFEDRDFSFVENENLTDMTALGNLQGDLQSTLRIYDCPNLVQLPVFNNLSSMNAFDITYCPKVTELNSFPSLTEIEFLSVADMDQLIQVAFPSMTKGNQIRLSNCLNLVETDFTSLTELSSEFSDVTSLKISEVYSLTTLEGFGSLENTSGEIDIFGNANPFDLILNDVCAIRTVFLNNGTDGNPDNEVRINSECYYYDSSFMSIAEFDANCFCN